MGVSESEKEREREERPHYVFAGEQRVFSARNVCLNEPVSAERRIGSLPSDGPW